MEKKYPSEIVAERKSSVPERPLTSPNTDEYDVAVKQLSCDILGLCASKQPFKFDLYVDILKLLTSTGAVWSNLKKASQTQVTACFDSATAYWKQIVKYIPHPPTSARNAAFLMYIGRAKSVRGCTFRRTSY